MNTNRSAGVINDVAQIINDKNDAGYGTGEVLFGNYAPLPAVDVLAGWKAEDGATATNGIRVPTLYAYKGPNLVNGGLTATRPLHYKDQGTTVFNNKSNLRYDGVDEYLDANATTELISGTQKTVFVVLKTGAVTDNDMIVYKHGDEDQGVSVVVDDQENLEITIAEIGRAHV